MYDVLVKNGRIVTADSVSEGNIAIRDGKIAAVLNAGEQQRLLMQKEIMYSQVQSIRMHI